MAPEQAKGKPVDKRADIWAFGCVLFEMLTGRRAFDGEDVTDTLASVLRAEPDFTALSKNSSPAIARIVRRCLVRDPKQRTRDIGDLRIQFDEATTVAPPRRRRRRPVSLVDCGRRLPSRLLRRIATGVPAMLRATRPGVEYSRGGAIYRSGPRRLAVAPQSLWDGFQHGVVA